MHALLGPPGLDDLVDRESHAGRGQTLLDEPQEDAAHGPAAPEVHTARAGSLEPARLDSDDQILPLPRGLRPRGGQLAHEQRRITALDDVARMQGGTRPRRNADAAHARTVAAPL